jgi:Zn-finger nucleic acid-binding protein
LHCPRCHDIELATGGPLSSSTCDRCGGGFVPEDGFAVLLDEIKCTREEVRELASLYGGERIVCASCRSKMSPLTLRGQKVDVCFGCGSLWVDAGELEGISLGRHALPAPKHPPSSSSFAAPGTAHLAPAQALVRVDERSAGRHVLRAVLAGSGALGVVWSLVGIAPGSSAVLGVAALGVSIALSRRDSLDVLPRARRMMRWRGWFPPDKRAGQGDAFSADSCVVVRAVRVAGRELPWLALDLVDGEGRTLTRLKGPMLAQRAWTEAPRYARALGVSVRFDVDPRADDELDAAEAARTDLPSFSSHDVVRIVPDATVRGRSLRVRAGDGTELGVAATEIPLRGRPKTLEQILAEHFVVNDAGGDSMRLFSSRQLGARATVLVGKDGRALGHVAVSRSPFADTFALAGPQARRAAKVVVRHGALQARIVDGYGRVVGVLELGEATPAEPRPATLHLYPGRLTGDARWCLLALALHASIVAAAPDVE